MDRTTGTTWVWGESQGLLRYENLSYREDLLVMSEKISTSFTVTRHMEEEEIRQTMRQETSDNEVERIIPMTAIRQL